MNLLNHPLMAALRSNWFDWVWAGFVIGFVLIFAVLEALALMRGYDTLSAFMWRLSSAWPPFGWLSGLIVGFLAAHFFWPHQGL